MRAVDAERLVLRQGELARRLGVSRQTISNWTRRGKLPCLRIGRLVLYPYSELCRWLQQASGGRDAEDGSHGDEEA